MTTSNTSYMSSTTSNNSSSSTFATNTTHRILPSSSSSSPSTTIASSSSSSSSKVPSSSSSPQRRGVIYRHSEPSKIIRDITILPDIGTTSSSSSTSTSSSSSSSSFRNHPSQQYHMTKSISNGTMKHPTNTITTPTHSNSLKHAMMKFVKATAAAGGGTKVSSYSTTIQQPHPSSLSNQNRSMTMIQMLNTKGIMYMEQQQYVSATRNFTRALRMYEQYHHLHQHPSTTSTTTSTTNDDSISSSLLLSSTKTKSSSSSSNISTTHSLSSLLRRPIEQQQQQHTNPMELQKEVSSIALLSMTEESLSSDASSSSSTTVGVGQQSQPSSSPYKHRAEYDEGMDYFRTPLQIDHDIQQNNHQCIEGILLYNLGRNYHTMNQYDDAILYYKRSLRVLEQYTTTIHNNHTTTTTSIHETLTVSILFGIGQIQYIRGDHMESLQTYQMTLQYSISKFHHESIEVAACYNCIGVLHYIMPKGNSTMALSSLLSSLQIRTKLLGHYHSSVGTTYNNIGRIYFQQSLYDDAIKAYHHALQIRKLCSSTTSSSSSSHTKTSTNKLSSISNDNEAMDSVDVAATLFNIGQVYHQLGDKDRALKHYQEFLKLAKYHFGDYHRDICIVTTCIGQVLHEKKEYTKALKAFHYALKVGKVALGAVHAEIAITLNKLGNLYYESGDLESALKAYHQGLQVELTVLEPGNPNVYVTYTNIAEIHKQKSEYDKALSNYERVLALQRKYDADPLDIANTLSSIGYIRHQIGDYPGAMDVNQECLRLRREVKGDIDEDVAATLTHIALVLLKLESHDMALELLTEAYRIRTTLCKNTDNGENRDIAFTLYNIALIYHHLGSYERALVYYLETARVEKAALGLSHRDLSVTYYNIGQIYYQRGEMDLAIQHFKEALAIEQECFGMEHPTCARTLNEIGNIALQLGNIEQVMDCYIEALRIYRKGNVSDDHLVIYGRSLWRFEVVQPEAAGAA